MNKSSYSVQVYIATKRSTLLTWTLEAYKHMFIQNCRLLTVLQIHVSFTWEKFFFLNDVYSICPSFGSQFSQSVHIFWNLFINKRFPLLGLHICLDKQIVSLLCNWVPRWHYLLWDTSQKSCAQAITWTCSTNKFLWQMIVLIFLFYSLPPPLKKLPINSDWPVHSVINPALSNT